MPGETQVKLLDDSTNPGQHVRAYGRSVGGTDKLEHYFHIAQPETVARATVSAAGADTTLRAAAQGRRSLFIWNNSPESRLKVKYGTAASASSWDFIIPPGSGSPLPIPWAGVVNGFWDNDSAASVTGDAHVTETTL